MPKNNKVDSIPLHKGGGVAEVLKFEINRLSSDIFIFGRASQKLRFELSPDSLSPKVKWEEWQGSPQKGKRLGLPWSMSIHFPVDCVVPEILNIVMFDENREMVRLELPLDRAVDCNPEQCNVSGIDVDPSRGVVSVRGWSGVPWEPAAMRFMVDGRPCSMRVEAHSRPDLLKKYPLFGKRLSGWRGECPISEVFENFDGEHQPKLRIFMLRPDGSLAETYHHIPFTGEIRAKLNLVSFCERVREKVKKVPQPRLERLLSSAAFQKRWAKGPLTTAALARRLIVSELIARDDLAKEIDFRLVNGDLVSANPAKDRVMARAFLLEGGYEPGFVEFIQGLVRPGETAIDVGAAYGVVTRALARGGVRVVAVEANPRMAESIDKSLPRNGISTVEIVRKAVSDMPGTVSFGALDEWNVGGSKLIGSALESERLKLAEEISSLAIIPLAAGEKKYAQLAPDSVRVESVEATTLDAICREFSLSDVAFLKMDIEGAEFLAIQGGRGLLNGEFGKPPIVALEFSRLVPVMGGSPEEVFEYFRSRGWTIYVQLGGKSKGGRLKSVPSIEEAPTHDNIICVPPEKFAVIEGLIG